MRPELESFNTPDLLLLSHAVAAAAFLLLATLAGTSWRRRGGLGAGLILAALATALWAGLVAYEATATTPQFALVRFGEVLRSTSWILFLVLLLTHAWREADQKALRPIPVSAAGICAAVLVNEAVCGLGGFQSRIAGLDLSVAGRLGLAVLGLLLVENLFRNTRAEHRWGIKFLCLGLAGLFTYDIFLLADSILMKQPNEVLLAARGLANTLIVPLIAVSAARNPSWSIDMSVSRGFVFQTATLFAAGLYLLVMAGAGYYVQSFGGEWGPAIQTLFLFAAVITGAVIAASGATRAWLRVFIAKHFFTYRYDYRREWLRFIRTVSASEHGRIHGRVIEAIASIVDSPEGALFLSRAPDRFSLAGTWNYRMEDGAFTAEPSLTGFLEAREWVVDLDEHRRSPEAYDDVPLPAWLRDAKRGWLAVPLLHNHRLTGLLLLGRPRVPRQLNWEDYDLLKTVGRQSASYLAEHEAARQLAESQQFDEFNRRFAFVIHDIKNLASQLSLLLNNAKKHKDNPAFQEDMLETVEESVEKMKQMLVRLHEGGKDAASHVAIDLAPFLRRAIERTAHKAGQTLAFECQAEWITVAADEERLSVVIAHLVDNALEAIGDDGRVDIRLHAKGGEAIIQIEDDGPGMAPAFIRDELFKPFRSTKSGGYGIGAFESRETVQDLGGRLEVFSRLGDGTMFRITLPAFEKAEPEFQSERV